MNNKILVITPPDKVFNQNQDILLVHPSDRIKDEMHDLLSKKSGGQNIYIYDPDDENHDLDWLLTVARMASVVIVDVDNCYSTVRDLLSYIISLPHTYWLTSDNKSCYTLLNPNRIYHLDVLEHAIGGKFEETTSE